MKFYLKCCIFSILTSCANFQTETTLHELPLTKQRQKIAFLQKKLQIAEKEQKRVEEEVERLHEEVSLAKLSLISKWVDQCELEIRQNPKKWSTVQTDQLFIKERASLYEMIQSSPYSFEAQMVLDKILQIITELSDAKKEKSDLSCFLGLYGETS